MHLDPSTKETADQIIAFYKLKIELHGRLLAVATQLMAGPKPGVDYGKLAAEMPKLRATLEGIDESQ